MIQGHGGNIAEAAAALGCRLEEIIDMSSNINPLGTPPGLLEHLGRRLPVVCALPQVDAAKAVTAYAEWQGLAPGRVLAGAGTTQFLYQLPAALKISSAIVVSPTYADYADALAMNGVVFRHFKLTDENGFAPDLNALADAAETVDAVFFCNPNNPTGYHTPTDAIEQLANACPDTRFVIDESYLPFVDGCGDDSIAYRDLPNVIVLQSLSKMFCIPGLRVGFCVAAEDTVEKIARRSPPWAVNALAQEAVTFIAANAEDAAAHVANTRKYLVAERDGFLASLENVPNVQAFSGQATFILIRLYGLAADDLVRHMLEHRFLIRDCSNFHGLSDRFVRVSLKGQDENREAARLIEAFAEQHDASCRRKAI